MKIDRYPDIESNGGLTSSIHQSARNSTASIFICTRMSGLLSRQAIPHTAQLIILVTNCILMFLMIAVISVKGAFVENKSCYIPCLIVCVSVGMRLREKLISPILIQLCGLDIDNRTCS